MNKNYDGERIRVLLADDARQALACLRQAYSASKPVRQVVMKSRAAVVV